MGSDHSQRGGNFPLDMNMYATRKTLAQGMLDLALLSANACQLRRALSVPPGQRFFGASVAFLGLSIALQLLAGFLLVLLGRWNINCPWEQRRADTLNNVVVLLAFLISVVNVLLSAFSPDIQPPEDPHKVYRPQNGWFDAPQ
ncbi:ninjurin-1 [Ixodes scapularis]|uniref:ninjurin-1 n=1 Tax=Ixodes scapularis TaxID=6945 RepID=UPI001A9F80BD|nr:ninjurin-1 [Ixodes scapularis]